MLALNLAPVYWLIFSPNDCPVCLPMVLLSDSLIDKGLVTVIKSKTGRTKSNDNYRPTPLASVVGKVAEIEIYNRIAVYIDTCPNQFGFKRNYITDKCIWVLKEIIGAYRVLYGSVFTCFLDASKAFD